MYREKDRLEEIPPWETGLFLVFPYLHEDKVLSYMKIKWLLPVDYWNANDLYIIKKNWKKPNCLLGTFCLLLTIYACC